MAYLMTAEYVARFGERETTILTRDGGSGSYDSAKVDAAISDAQEVVDGYVKSAGYAVPIASPPGIVKGWTAALAREALHVNVNKVSEAVRDAADRVRGQLRDLQAGKMGLPIPAGQSAPAQTNTLGLASSSHDRDAPIFAGTGALDGFIGPFLGASLPAWRNGG